MKLTLLLIPLILLSSCTIDWNDEKDAKITTLEKQVTELKEKNDDELFKKRQECSSLFDSINFRLKNYKSDYTFELEEVFYSPKLGQCVYIDYFQSDITMKRLMSIGNNVGWNPINDMSCEFSKINDCVEFDKKIPELKWE